MSLIYYGLGMWALSTIPGVNLGTGLYLALLCLFAAIGEAGSTSV